MIHGRTPDIPMVEKLLAAISRKADRIGRVSLMEVCGTHTHEIGKLGLRQLLPKNIRLISGPGCPVCVTPGAYIDAAAELACRPGLTVCSYGDMVRVPGNRTSLAAARAAGGSVIVVTSPLEAVTIAAQQQSQQFVVLGVGFETTIPATVRAVTLAKEKHLENISFLTSHRLVPPALDVLCSDTDLAIDGFILPGHVSAIIGEQAYEGLARYGVPGVITGFEAAEILAGLTMLLDLVARKQCSIMNAYRRVVPAGGNPTARAAIDATFVPVDAVWRGIGSIPGSGLALRQEFAAFDSHKRFDLDFDESAMPDGCSCGEVLKGKITPSECPLFGSLCTPEQPQGPCMVSSEGSCAAYHKYGL